MDQTIATRLLNQGMPIYSLRKLLRQQNLGTTWLYARSYDEALYKQFKAVTSRLEATEDVSIPSFTIGKRNPV